MNITPWRKRELAEDPFHLLSDEMDELFDFPLSRFALTEGNWAPAIDISDSKNHVVIKADIPGMTKEDIKVSVEEGALVIKGEKKAEHETKENNFVRIERSYGSFYRAIPLPKGVDAKNVNATYKDGVLELTLPKTEEAKPKQINVEVR